MSPFVLEWVIEQINGKSVTCTKSTRPASISARFNDKGLVDELPLMVFPIIFGRGRKLFG